MGRFVASGGQELVTDASPSFLGQMVLKPNPEAFSRYVGIDQLVLLRGGRTLIKKITGLHTGFPSFLFFYPLILTPSWITFPNKLSTHKPVGEPRRRHWVLEVALEGNLRMTCGNCQSPLGFRSTMSLGPSPVAGQVQKDRTALCAGCGSQPAWGWE